MNRKRADAIVMGAFVFCALSVLGIMLYPVFNPLPATFEGVQAGFVRLKVEMIVLVGLLVIFFATMIACSMLSRRT